MILDTALDLQERLPYKVDTLADGNLVPLRDLQRVQPGIGKNELAHMINPSVNCEAYNGTEIKQYSEVFVYHLISTLKSADFIW